jgi:hypothetical protein
LCFHVVICKFLQPTKCYFFPYVIFFSSKLDNPAKDSGAPKSAEAQMGELPAEGTTPLSMKDIEATFALHAATGPKITPVREACLADLESSPEYKFDIILKWFFLLMICQFYLLMFL